MSLATRAFFKEVLDGFHNVSLLSPAYESLQAEPYRQMIMHQFITAFWNPESRNIRPNAWVYQLPSLMSTHPASALVYSVRAASMAHFGKRTGNVSMQVEACRWYDRGLESQRLESQRTELQLRNGDSVHQRLDAATISAPLMFSLFESMMTTSFAAWSEHLKAAGKMLEMRGPEGCQTGLIHHLFRTVRVGAVSLTCQIKLFSGPLTQYPTDLPWNDVRAAFRFCFTKMVRNPLSNTREEPDGQAQRHSASVPTYLSNAKQHARIASSRPTQI